jgi:FKBP-type peptidyl-prolyl cis-trans isomerase FklB
MSLFDRLQGAQKEKIQKQKDAGAAFMAENKNKEGVVELPNGI